MYGSHEIGAAEFGGEGGALQEISGAETIGLSENFDLETLNTFVEPDAGPGVSDRAWIRTGNFSVLINGIDRSLRVVMGTLRKRETANNRTSTMQFSVRKYGSFDYTPEQGDEVRVYDPNDNLIFAGILSSAKKGLDGAILIYDLQFVGFESKLSARRVLEHYESTTGDVIIADLKTKYMPDFTIAGVDADFAVANITFNRITLKEAIDKLAKLANYTWYVDYLGDLHFFPRFSEVAPISLSPTSANFDYQSLEINDDYSQLKNRVFVEGGEIEGISRTEHIVGESDRRNYALSNKFSKLPTLEVNSVAKTLGVDFLSNEDDFDAFWNFSEKYIRFKDATAPVDGDDISVAGIPLYTLITQVQDDASIADLGGDPEGVHEFYIKDSAIKSEDDGRARAQAELEAYSTKVVEGSFITNTPGLRAGQIISINLPDREVAGDFVIQSVAMKLVSRRLAEYSITLATLRTLTLIDILITELQNGTRIVDDKDNSVLQRSYFPRQNLGIQEIVARDVDAEIPQPLTIAELLEKNAGEPEFVFAPYVPSSLSSDVKVGARYGRSTYQ